MDVYLETSVIPVKFQKHAILQVRVGGLRFLKSALKGLFRNILVGVCAGWVGVPQRPDEYAGLYSQLYVQCP